MTDSRPFVYVTLSGHDASGCIEAREEGEKIVVTLKDDKGRRKDVGVNGIFTNVAQPEQIFQAAVLPMSERVLQGTLTCTVATLGGKGPQLFAPDGLAYLTLRHIMTAVDGNPGALRVGLQCFLNDPARPTDLLKNVQQKVPENMQWEHEEVLDGQHFVFCATLDSAMRTLNAVLSAPSLTDLLHRLSFSLTIAVKKKSARLPSRLTLLELRAEACKYIPSTLVHVFEGTNHANDMISRAIRGCRPFDCVLIGQCHSDALRYKHSENNLWNETQNVFDCLTAVRDLPAHMMVATPPPSVSVVSPSPRKRADSKLYKTEAVARESQKVQVDVHLHMPEDDHRRGSSKPPVMEYRDTPGSWTPRQERSNTAIHTASFAPPSPIEQEVGRSRETDAQIAILEKELTTKSRQAQEDKDKLELATAEAKKMGDLARMQTEEAERNVSACQELHTEVQRLKFELKEISHEGEAARQSRDEYAADANSARAELRRLKTTLADSQYDLASQKKSHDRAVTELNEEVEDLRAELTRTRDGRVTATTELDGLQREIRKLRSERDELSGRLDHEQEVAHQQRGQLAFRTCETDELEKRLSLASEEETVAAMLCRADMEARHRILQHSKLRAATAELTEAKQEADHHMEKIVATEASLRALEQSNLAASASSKAEIADLLNQIHVISAERDRRTSTAEKLTIELNELSGRCKQLQDANIEAETAVSRLERRVAEVEHQYETEKASKAALQTTAVRLEAEKNSLQENNQRVESELREQQHDYQDIKDGFQERVKKLETALRETEEELASARHKAVASDGKDLREQLHVMAERVKTVEVENESLMKLRAQDSDEVRQLVNKLHAAEAELRKRSESPRSDYEWAAGREAFESKRHDVDGVLKLHSEIEERDAAILSLKDKLAKATKSKAEAERRERMARRRASDGSGATSTSPSTSPAARHRARERDIETTELGKLRAELTALQQRTSMAADEVSEERRAASVAVNDALAEVSSLQQNLKNSDKEIAMLRAEAQVASQEYGTVTERYEQSLGAYQSQLQQLDEQWRSRERSWVSRHQALEVQITSFTEQMRKIEAEKAEVEAQRDRPHHNFEELNIQLVEKSDFIVSLQSKLRETEAEVERLRREMERAQHDFESVQIEYERIQRERHERDIEMERLRHQMENMPEGGRQIQQIREEAKRREELLLGQIRSLVSHNHESGRPISPQRERVRETKAVSPPIKRVLSQVNPNIYSPGASYGKTRLGPPVPALSPRSDGSGDDSEDEHAKELKAKLAAVVAQNNTLRQQREKEKQRRDITPAPEPAGRLTELQRQKAADAIRSSSRGRHITSPGKKKDNLRSQLDSLTMQVKQGNFDRSQVENQLKQVLDSVKPGTKAKYNI
eukprot:TRINITY_DN7554_c0_g2_i1.p1 TRINITY_DN7554_c0_g2~~TRINITY_DN7554_c0_g2_i1.p1  ORF type:complete len:1384 (+),score=353.70 TRINITY_DN7554_c0_g2_i1:83-4234(+)